MLLMSSQFTVCLDRTSRSSMSESKRGGGISVGSSTMPKPKRPERARPCGRTFPKAIARAKSWIEQRHQPDGYNIGVNCGEAAGQTVMHFHCHVIPRYRGDVSDPRGGVRGVIPGKQKY